MNEMLKKEEVFLNDIRGIINSARQNAVRSVDFCRVQMYWHMGKRIFEEEQQGKDRADYGAYLNTVNWLFAVNSIGFIQLRTHCVHN